MSQTTMGKTAAAAAVRWFVLDVDGVLTDGSIYLGNDGEELKAFNIRDGLGLKLLQQAGVSIAIITGRRSEIVLRRARELGIDLVIQGRDDKRAALAELAQEKGIDLAHCAYMGDDLPDLGAIIAAGIGMTVANAPPAVSAKADWQSRYEGGCGAVREACEYLLECRGELDRLTENFR